MSSANNKTSTTVAEMVQRNQAEVFDLNCKLRKKENENANLSTQYKMSELALEATKKKQLETELQWQRQQKEKEKDVVSTSPQISQRYHDIAVSASNKEKEDLKFRLSNTEDDLEETIDELTKKEEKIRVLKDDLEELEETSQTYIGELAEKDDELAEKEEKIRVLKDDLEELEETSQTYIGELAEKDDELAEKEEKIRVLGEEKVVVEKAKEVLEYRSGALQQMLRTSYDQNMEMQVELNKSRQQSVVAKQEEAKAKEREEAANTRVNELSRKVTNTASLRGLLDTTQQERDIEKDHHDRLQEEKEKLQEEVKKYLEERNIMGKLLVGTRIRKKFDADDFEGTVKKYYPKQGLFKISYDDGDDEEFDVVELAKHRIPID